MVSNISPSQLPTRPEYSLRIGLVVDSPELLSEIARAIAEIGATQVFEFPGVAAPFEIANAVQREKPDVLFAELARASRKRKKAYLGELEDEVQRLMGELAEAEATAFAALMDASPGSLARTCRPIPEYVGRPRSPRR